jgi:hypothetical protein
VTGLDSSTVKGEMSLLRSYVMSLISGAATVALGLVSDLVLKLSAANTFLVVSTGGIVSLALGPIEQRLNSDQREFRDSITSELGEKLDLFRMVDEIDDPQTAGRGVPSRAPSQRWRSTLTYRCDQNAHAL